MEKRNTSSFKKIKSEKTPEHKRSESTQSELVKEAIEVINEAKKIEEDVIIFIKESKSFFNKMFECCNGEKTQEESKKI